MDDDDVVRLLEATKAKRPTPVRIEAKIKRGSGTRDQDDFRVSIQADDPGEARQLMDAVLDDAEANWLPRMRDELQPESYGPRMRECANCGDSFPVNSRWVGDGDEYCTTACWQESKAVPTAEAD